MPDRRLRYDPDEGRVLIDGTEILGKPSDAAQARDMLQKLRSRTHRVCTAITLKKLGDKTKTITKMDSTEVQMRAYSDDEIESYIASGDPFDKAGGYAIQDESFIPVVRIDGSSTVTAFGYAHPYVYTYHADGDISGA